MKDSMSEGNSHSKEDGQIEDASQSDDDKTRFNTKALNEKVSKRFDVYCSGKLSFRIRLRDAAKRIRVPFTVFIESIQKLIYWIPICFKDRDWDQDYFYKIMAHKLKAMADYHHKYGNSVDSEEISKQIREAYKLCVRLCEHDYRSEALKPFYEKYLDFTIKADRIPYDDGTGGVRVHFNLDDNPKIREQYDKYNKNSDKLYFDDKKKLLELFDKHLEQWWD